MLKNIRVSAKEYLGASILFQSTIMTDISSYKITVIDIEFHKKKEVFRLVFFTLFCLFKLTIQNC